VPNVDRIALKHEPIHGRLLAFSGEAVLRDRREAGTATQLSSRRVDHPDRVPAQDGIGYRVPRIL
jgi:hypothetical protein